MKLRNPDAPATPPEAGRRAWLDEVGDAFLRLRGSGLMLSPLDADRLRAYRDRGLPSDLVIDGLRAAHADFLAAGRAAARRTFTLRMAERRLDELANAWERRAPGGPTAFAHRDVTRQGAAHDRIVAHASALEPGSGAARAYDAALRVLAAEVADDSGRRLLEADEAAGIAYVIALPRHEQAIVVSEAMRRAGPRGAATRARHRAMLRAVLADAAFRRGGWTRPSDL